MPELTPSQIDTLLNAALLAQQNFARALDALGIPAETVTRDVTSATNHNAVTPAAIRQRRYRERNKASQTVTRYVTSVTDNATLRNDVTPPAPPTPAPAPFPPSLPPHTPPTHPPIPAPPPTPPHPGAGALTHEGQTEVAQTGAKPEVYPEMFNQAWEAYGRKGSKKLAYAEWKKLSLEDKAQVGGDIPRRLAKHLNGDPSRMQFWKDFERYLKHRVWESAMPGDPVYATAERPKPRFVPA